MGTDNRGIAETDEKSLGCDAVLGTQVLVLVSHDPWPDAFEGKQPEELEVSTFDVDLEEIDLGQRELR